MSIPGANVELLPRRLDVVGKRGLEQLRFQVGVEVSLIKYHTICLGTFYVVPHIKWVKTSLTY